MGPTEDVSFPVFMWKICSQEMAHCHTCYSAHEPLTPLVTVDADDLPQRHSESVVPVNAAETENKRETHAKDSEAKAER